MNDVSFRNKLSNFQSTLERKTSFRQIRRLISHAKRKRNYINASSTSVSAVEKTVRAEKCRKKSGAQKRSGEERDGWALPSFRRRLPVSNIGIGRRRRRGRGLGDACGKFKTYKTYKQTNFFPRRSYRHAAIVGRIADHSLPNANYLYSPLAIKTCRARGTTGGKRGGVYRLPRDEEVHIFHFRRNESVSSLIKP